MASLSESEFGAGGKIVTNRRKKRLSCTPYDRSQPPPPVVRSPSWFSGVIIPSARAIASGARKILSSVLYSDNSSSSEDDGSDSENDVENDNGYNVPSDGINELNKGNLEVIQSRQGSHSRVGKSDIKHVIEQLIMQEMFSREECDRLIKIINSRLVDYSTTEAGETRLLTLSPGETVGNENVDLHNRTVMEAKRWLGDKKMGSSPVSDLAYGTFGFNSTVPANIGSEVGSPVDMAKSYMKVRPPWASPTKQIEVRTPSTMMMEPFKEGTRYSVGNDSLSSLKNSLASGSWNIQEELRRVRSKATDEMLRSLSSKIDLSLAPKSSLGYVGTDIPAASMLEKKNELNPSTLTKSIDAPPNPDAGVRSNPILSASDSWQDGGVNDTLPSKPTTFVTGNNEDSEAILNDDECNASNPPHPAAPSTDVELHDDPRASDVKGSMTNGETEFNRIQSSDGYPSTQTSLSAQVGAGENDGPSDEGNLNNTVSQKNPVEDKCELLSETYIEVPVLTDLNTVSTGSQNSFNMQHEEFLPEPTLPAKKRELEEKAGGLARKPQGRKSVNYNRSGRGRGK
ncbi:protein KAKU4-like isoform X2 [Olea europaea var. sylvestris]|uniref:protein KAKU4-like isoform X2 n=1 Tax=Olea europaea var. sylvestris TaxID=158386 RepID=UPI000C1D6D7D|nr:protein KAKU4-like isoform X2 [Olea europaea var. sylvestris]